MVSSLYISFQGRTLELERRPDPLKENGAEIQVSGFYCNSTVILRFFSGLFLSQYKSL